MQPEKMNTDALVASLMFSFSELHVRQGAGSVCRQWQQGIAVRVSKPGGRE